MSGPDEIVAYIQNCRGQFPDSEIRQELIKAGVDPASVEEAFALLPEGGSNRSRKMIFIGIGAAAFVGLSLVGAYLLKSSPAQKTEWEPGEAASELRELARKAESGSVKDAREAVEAGLRHADQAVIRVRHLQTVQSLSMVRIALSNYYVNEADKVPKDLRGLIPRYMSNMPETSTVFHENSDRTEVYDGSVCTSTDPYVRKPPRAEGLRDTGRWGLIYDPESPCHGQLIIDCTHKDQKGRGLHEI